MAATQIHGLDFLGNMPDQTTLVPNRGYNGKGVGNRRFDIFPLPEPPVPLLNNAIQHSTLRKVLGTSTFDSIKIIRPPPVPSTDGMHPKTGIFRNEKKGLAHQNIPGKIIDGKIMPMTDSNFAWKSSKL